MRWSRYETARPSLATTLRPEVDMAESKKSQDRDTLTPSLDALVRELDIDVSEQDATKVTGGAGQIGMGPHIVDEI